MPANLELHEFEHDTPRMLAQGRRGQEQLFFLRLATALREGAGAYDVVVVDCPPQLGFLTLSALCAATSLVITIHPQMLDLASMCQFLLMTSDLLAVVTEAGGRRRYDFLRYLITRYEPQDGPQTHVVGLPRSLFGERVLTSPSLQTTSWPAASAPASAMPSQPHNPANSWFATLEHGRTKSGRLGPVNMLITAKAGAWADQLDPVML